MDRQTSLEREAQCIQDQPPACTATCPVHVDVRGMVEKIRDGDLAGGLALFAATIPFPRTIARICDRPCQAACKRAELGESIAIGALERACVDEARLPDVKAWPGARKKKRVAVVGGGLSGLTAAVDLARKGYPVALFEANVDLAKYLKKFRIPLDVKAGDLILFGKYSGQEIKLDGEEYLILREDEVLAIIEGASEKKKK